MWEKINDENFHSLHGNARLINAKTSTSHKYPWMAEVQRATVLSNDPGRFAVYHAGGVIISRNSILTAGHNICVDEKTKGKGPDSPKITCPIKSPTMSAQKWNFIRNLNLNSNEKNELTFSVGTNILQREITHHFNSKVRAYLYRYEPHDALFSENGDIGLLIIDGGIPEMSQPTASPICLPYPQHFHPLVKVNFAGWGSQYGKVDFSIGDPSGNTKVVTKTSCQTNEARIHDFSQLSSNPSFDKRIQFWDCQIKKAPQKFCNNWLLDQNIETMSIKTDLESIFAPSDVEKKIQLSLRLF